MSIAEGAAIAVSISSMYIPGSCDSDPLEHRSPASDANSALN
jgi:hypothetical protein